MSTDADYERRKTKAAQYLVRYMDGDDRYVRMARELFGRRLGATQARILRAVARNRRVLVVSGNGVGKSYAVALAILCFLYSNPDSIAMLTSGSYSMLTDTTWRPMQSIFKEAKEEMGLPGRAVGGEGGSPPRLDTGMGDEWYFKAVSPTHPDNLEGRHSSDILVVIEEADKPDITDQHFESAETSITDANDRMVAVANPPEDEGNIVHEKMESDRWTTIQFSSFESHNVLADAGETDADPIPGLVDLPTVAEDYEEWNDTNWPKVPTAGIEVGPEQYDGWPGVATLHDAVNNGDLPREKLVDMLVPGVGGASTYRDGMDTRWYRRRLGVVPPDDSRTPRPFTVGDVEDAEARWPDADPTQHRQAMAADIARGGGDRTAIAEIFSSANSPLGARMEITATQSHVDHTDNENRIGDRITAAPLNGGIAIDAVGEGSAVEDTIRRRFPSHRVERFAAGASAEDDANYGNARTEALEMLGRWLRDGGAIEPGSELAEELKVHARYCEYEEATLRSATVYKATPKDDIADHLGQSPDLVDAAMMAAWADGGYGLGTIRIGAVGSEYE